MFKLLISCRISHTLTDSFAIGFLSNKSLPKLDAYLVFNVRHQFETLTSHFRLIDTALCKTLCLIDTA